MANKNDPHSDQAGSAMEITLIQNISYYNYIAGHYNHMLEERPSNAIVREKVAERFTQWICGGVVLDFGGGTGLDLVWLTRQYEVVFCEPSTGMRREAIVSAENKSIRAIRFLSDEEANFRYWNHVIPFHIPIDAILANFAVLNCIPDIGLFFERMASILKPGGALIAVILKTGIRHSIRSCLGLGTAMLKISFNEQQHIAFVHSIGSIRKAAGSNFTLSYAETLDGSDFTLLKLLRK
jgi:SAM-dependent methyltransferase